MRYESIIEARGSVTFPDFAGERVYMEPFFKKEGLPTSLKHWQKTVDAMLDGIDTDGPVYLMIDQSAVKAGNFQRRPGLHIDGYWNPGNAGHGGHRTMSGHGTHRSIVTSHYPAPFRHGPTRAPAHRPLPTPRVPRRHESGAFGSLPWEQASFSDPEAIILATNIQASRGFTGTYSGPIGDMGDCNHVDTSEMKEIQINCGRVYAGNVTMLHETLQVQEDSLRTLVRLNVPGWTP